ncbi:hypothetical protein TrRE_jg8943 [Triparma retinervis]|uniref:Uncharacterized protein n=1 Tax=Triparma retinervis TaxID=2557542 RepID=A0A9W7E0K0_9STRA|nr:hypothetical protein TrRE_jg8943 [Triparma retinervis]
MKALTNLATLSCRSWSLSSPHIQVLSVSGPVAPTLNGSLYGLATKLPDLKSSSNPGSVAALQYLSAAESRECMPPTRRKRGEQCKTRKRRGLGKPE